MNRRIQLNKSFLANVYEREMIESKRERRRDNGIGRERENASE
jgi:hypothetical protein